MAEQSMEEEIKRIQEIKRILDEMDVHVTAKGGFPGMSMEHTSLWCSDGNAACMIEFLVRQLAELRLRVAALEGPR